MGAASQRPQDRYGEVALLLDALDLVLHSAASATSGTPDSPQTILDHPSSADSDIIESSPEVSKAAQAVSQTDKYADSLLWGLRALEAMAKQGTLAEPCSQMLTEYILQRIVMLSRDWPMEVGQAAAQVSMSHAAWASRCHMA